MAAAADPYHLRLLARVTSFHGGYEGSRGDEAEAAVEGARVGGGMGMGSWRHPWMEVEVAA